MKENSIKIPSSQEIKKHIIKSLEKYWLDEGLKIQLSNLPIPQIKQKQIQLPLKCTLIKVPFWGKEYGIQEKILIPNEAIIEKKWNKVDWWLAAFLLLECCHEREFENLYGPIHSYSNLLKNWDKRVWEKAWVNRIALFLRSWISEENSSINLPHIKNSEIRFSHDLDAISKTLPIRIKQTLRFIYHRNFVKAFDFFFKKEDWFIPQKLIELENDLIPKPIINIHSKDKFRGPFKWFLDPGYEISNPKLKKYLKEILKKGWSIGLHPSFFSWKSSELIRKEKFRLEKEFGISVISVRQHWLKFSWEKTWAAQAQAGIEIDTTLMFNDKPGFRNSAVVDFKSYYCSEGPTIRSTVYMDSHLGRSCPSNIIDEINFVKGNADLLWHTHTLNKDYGYFQSLKNAIKKTNRNAI